MAVTFASGSTLNDQGQVVPVVDATPTPDPAAAQGNERAPVGRRSGASTTSATTGSTPVSPPQEPDAAGESADGEPSPPSEPEVSEEEAAVADAPPRANRPFVARTIRENERLKQALAARDAQIAYLTTHVTQREPASAQPQPGPMQPPVPADPPRPRPDAFPTHEDYVEALTTWAIDKRDRAFAAQAEAQREAVARQSAQQQWAQREEEGRDTYDDYDEVVQRPLFAQPIAPIVAETVRDSAQGAALLYYLGQHPKDVQHLNGLTPLAAARWLGQLEARLAPAPASPPRGASPPWRVTSF